MYVCSRDTFLSNLIVSGKNTPLVAHNLRVVVKTTNRLDPTDETMILDVEKVRVHPLYDATRNLNDIAIAKLNRDIRVDGRLAEVIPITNSAPKPGTHCTVAGWGRLLEVCTRHWYKIIYYLLFLSLEWSNGC